MVTFELKTADGVATPLALNGVHIDSDWNFGRGADYEKTVLPADFARGATSLTLRAYFVLDGALVATSNTVPIRLINLDHFGE
jgi:hypothetical protein